MPEITINASKAKAHFSEIASRAAYGGNTYVVEKMQKPLVVVMSYEEYLRIKKGKASSPLAEIKKLHRYLRKKYGPSKTDSVKMIRQARAERTRHLVKL
jgi:prevent-host-death family protein